MKKFKQFLNEALSDIDKVLDKMNTKGYNNLNDREKELLKKYSRGEDISKFKLEEDEYSPSTTMKMEDMLDDEVEGIIPDLPEKFKIIDKGYYSHAGVVKYGEPYKFIIKWTTGDKLVIEYDNNYTPIKSYKNDILDNRYIKLLNLHENDPRYIINNYEPVSLEEYGLKGVGYIVTDADLFGTITRKIAKFNDANTFNSYVFMRRRGIWREFKQQRWLYSIKPL